MATISQVVSYYVARMASIYRSKPKASAQVALFAKQLLADNLASELNSAHDIDQAYGDQLDTIGKYIGVSRNINVPDFRVFFGMVSYAYPEGDQNLHGFTSYTSLSLNADGVFLRYQTQALAVTQLTDFSYKQLIRLKVFVNFSNNTLSEALALAQQFFPGQIRIRDNQDMSLSYYYGRQFQLPYVVLSNSFLRPMGVLANVKPISAWDAFLGALPIFNSETQGDKFINFGNVTLSALGVFSVKNVTATPITIAQFYLTDSSGVWTMSTPVPSAPTTLAEGEAIEATLSGFTYAPGLHIAILTMVVTSESSGTRFYLIPVIGTFSGPSAFSPGFSNGFVNN